MRLKIIFNFVQNYLVQNYILYVEYEQIHPSFRFSFSFSFSLLFFFFFFSSDTAIKSRAL